MTKQLNRIRTTVALPHDLNERVEAYMCHCIGKEKRKITKHEAITRLMTIGAEIAESIEDDALKQVT